MQVRDFLNAGISVIPIVPGAKNPRISSWKEMQTRIATPNEAATWDYPIAAIAGQVSGGLHCIDFDNQGSAFSAYMQLLAEQIPETMVKLVIQATPSGGRHIIYRTEAETANQKLAMLNRQTVLIETRGEGGYFLVAPSDGYKVLEGSFQNVNLLSAEEHNYLLSVARTFNEHHEEHKPHLEDVTPFDAYDEQHDPIDVLTGAGWTVAFRRGDAIYLSRPGKTRGISATWNYVPNRFYCFSTSTPFENKVYKASAVYAILCHNGDFRAAAKELWRNGYGQKNTPEEEAQTYHKSAFMEKVDHFLVHGLPPGVPFGLPRLEKLYSVVPGQVNIVSGFPGSGKSELVDTFMVNIARLRSQWRFVVYSPENYPVAMHFRKLAEKYLNRKIWKGSDPKSQDMMRAKKFVFDHFVFIDGGEDGCSLEKILLTAKNNRAAGLVIDPWNELDATRPTGVSSTDYIGNSLSMIRRFARKQRMCVWIVCHPAKPMKNKDGTYNKPTLYDLAGSAHWFNKGDNGIIVWRDYDKGVTEVIVQKIKFKYYGQPGTVTMKYRYDDGAFIEQTDEEDLNGF